MKKESKKESKGFTDSMAKPKYFMLKSNLTHCGFKYNAGESISSKLLSDVKIKYLKKLNVI